MLVEFVSTEPVVITVTTSLHSRDLPDPAPEVSKSVARIYFTQMTLGPSFDLHADAPGASRGLIDTSSSHKTILPAEKEFETRGEIRRGSGCHGDLAFRIEFAQTLFSLRIKVITGSWVQIPGGYRGYCPSKNFS